MPIVERIGSIFTSEAQTLVNTVNCLGVMGAGIALEMRYRHPEMFSRYAARCEAGEIRIGTLDLDTRSTPWILNFPTKKHWRHPSRPEFLRAGLAVFRNSWDHWGIESIAFPLLGASHGGLAPEDSRRIMTEYLDDLPIHVEIWAFDASSPDELIESLRRRLANATDRQISTESGLSVRIVAIARDSVATLTQLNQFGLIPGFGEGAMEKLYRYAKQLKASPAQAEQESLPFA
jgi:O-acetyl-ADP-ribose deacetylase (regulator of RNase III)